MSAIEDCRTAVLGGHVARCENSACGFSAISYCSCRNRHCPKCHGSRAREWLEARKAELLQVLYFHVVFTLPSKIAAIAVHNKAVIYDPLFKSSAETLTTIEADPTPLTRQCRLPSSLADSRYGWRMADSRIGGRPDSSKHHVRRQKCVQSSLSGPPPPVGTSLARQRPSQHAPAALTALPKSQ